MTDVRALERLAEPIGELLAKVGQLIEAHPGALIDAARLPLGKPAMVRAFKAAWLFYGAGAQRHAVETGWLLLSSFQDGIGETPVTLDAPERPTPEALAQLDHAIELFKRSTAEGELLLKDQRAFYAANADVRH